MKPLKIFSNDVYPIKWALKFVKPTMKERIDTVFIVPKGWFNSPLKFYNKG